MDKCTQTVNEQALVERCRRRERAAQQDVFERTSAPVYRLLLRMTGNPDDAFDLAQETYLKGFARIDQFDGRSTIATWFYRIAANEALQFLRRRKKTRLKMEDLAINRDNGRYQTNPTDVRMDIRAGLAKLDPSARVILLLRYQDGLDYRTIAQVVGCAEGTVASRLNRARHRLRDILGTNYNPREETGAAIHPIK